MLIVAIWIIFFYLSLVSETAASAKKKGVKPEGTHPEFPTSNVEVQEEMR
ncbi:MAG: hypothetical protein OXU51_06490 [Candidatus Poribacteria bacterium]|nr:hypothetical protein [Candidatus Poribacteria bacterium]